MLRVSETSREGEVAVLRLEGEMIGPWVEVVKKACEPFLSNGHQLTIDLADISHVDRNGIALLKKLMQAQAKLINESPFLSAQLRVTD